ncbi:uncharacterized protein LOC136094703 [Hydra vulgaris]|uniref:uncharacterized protein LOC136094703 n=1 Tax=Hydra vulgaris TaxID=6087 RepID=UPI0032EA0C54
MDHNMLTEKEFSDDVYLLKPNKGNGVGDVSKHIMYEKLYSYVDANNILYSKQFGFKKRHSTDQVIVHLVHDIFKSFDEDKYTLGVFIDLSKGSILGPLLFLIYINDISNACTELDTILFADDTNLFCVHNDINILFKSVNKGLLNLTEWFNASKLSLNVTKTKYTFFHRFHDRDKIPLKFPKLCIANHNIKKETTLKFLGVLFDENITWKDHIHYLENKISRNIGLLG